jgi:predicted deacylase
VPSVGERKVGERRRLDYRNPSRRHPALTLGLGGSRGFEPDMVRADVEGIDNVLARYVGEVVREYLPDPVSSPSIRPFE